MTYETIFNEVKSSTEGLDVSAIQEHLAFQFTITGEGEGKFYVEVDHGTLNVEPYDYKDCDAEFVADAKTLTKILSGKKDPVVAFSTGKLKVHGSLEKALLLKDFVSKNL